MVFQKISKIAVFKKKEAFEIKYSLLKSKIIMKIRFSYAMKKVIEDFKKESLEIIQDMKNLDKKLFKRKPTKNKTFEFEIIKINDKPFIKLFINEKFHSSIFMFEGKWCQE